MTAISIDHFPGFFSILNKQKKEKKKLMASENLITL